VGEHGADQRGQLGGRLAFLAQRHCEGGDLGVGRLAGQHSAERALGEVSGQVLASNQAAQHVGPQRVGHCAALPWFPTN